MHNFLIKTYKTKNILFAVFYFGMLIILTSCSESFKKTYNYDEIKTLEDRGDIISLQKISGDTNNVNSKSRSLASEAMFNIIKRSSYGKKINDINTELKYYVGETVEYNTRVENVPGLGLREVEKASRHKSMYEIMPTSKYQYIYNDYINNIRSILNNYQYWTNDKGGLRLTLVIYIDYYNGKLASRLSHISVEYNAYEISGDVKKLIISEIEKVTKNNHEEITNLIKQSIK